MLWFNHKSPTVSSNQRYAVIGFSGTGKTVFSAKLARVIGAAHIELDGIYWGENWSRPNPDDFNLRIRQVLNALNGDAWVIDGNHTEIRELVWDEADTIIWLDYSKSRVLWHLLKRTLKNILTRKLLWNSNRESVCRLLSHKSILLRAWLDYDSSRNTILTSLNRYILDRKPNQEAKRIIRFTSPARAQQWLDYLQSILKNV